MALSPGTRLGVYEVTAQIGEGGMGQVYRARDTKLDRDVAIKILPEAFAHDAERLARFEREAKTLASLNHPNIAAIYGLEEAAGVQALVLELVEGPTLADRIAKGPIPLDEAMPIARQIAEAVEAAHEHGIIHRDLKPANVKVRDDGVVKVLDFGLAKAISGDGSGPAGAALSQSPTITSPAGVTGVGVLLGTAAYMSPEQAKGRAADKRSDIWAFGCVLYEVLTGQRAFSGEDVSDTLAAILRAEPDWTVLPTEVPANIRTLLKRCLEKDRKARIGDVSTVRYVMDEAAAPMVAPIPTPAAPARRRLIALTVSALVVGAASAAIVTWAVTRPEPAAAPQPIRFTVAGSLSVASPNRDVAISPDGRRLVYVTGTVQNGALWVRAVNDLEAVQLRGLPTTALSGPFISPDSKWIVFASLNDLRKVSMTGGPSISIGTANGGLLGASWAPEDTIIFGSGDIATGLLSVPAGGGDPKVLTKPDPGQSELDHLWPFVLPGGHAVLFTITTSSGLDNAQIAALDLSSGQRKILIRGGTHAEYVDPSTSSGGPPSAGSGQGYLVYAAAGSLRAVRFDPIRLEVLSDPVPVLEQVATKRTGAADFSVSQDGALVYVPGGVGGPVGAQRSLVWVDRQGREEPVKAPARAYLYPRVSPDGTRIALDIRDQQNDIWILDLAHDTLTPLTIDPANDQHPVWTIDGTRVIFSSGRHGGALNLYWQTADGTGIAGRLTTSEITQHGLSIAPDGLRLVVRETPATNPQTNLSVLRLVGSSTTAGTGKLLVEPLLKAGYIEDNGVVSPDGRWLAYESNESGQAQVYVRPFPNVDSGRTPISIDGGTRPLWAPNGRELFYIGAGGLLNVVPVQTSPTFSRGNSTTLLKTQYFLAQGRSYDISRDGQRFLMIKDPTGQTSAPVTMTVVVNWLEELKRLVPTK